jgi:hypothetical protein
VQVYALTSSQCLYETLDLFLSRETAEAELREILQDEPDWKDVLRVVPIELDGRRVSVNKVTHAMTGLPTFLGRCVFFAWPELSEKAIGEFRPNLILSLVWERDQVGVQ